MFQPFISLATAEPKELVQYGALGIFCMALITAVIYLSKDNRKLGRQARAGQAKWDEERTRLLLEQANERGEHAREVEALRADYEERHTSIAEDTAQDYAKLAHSFAAELRADRDASRAHEDETRREFCELMEKVTVENGKSAQATIAVMEKFYHRFIGPKARY